MQVHVPQTANATFRTSPLAMDLKVSVTPTGLLAVAGLVTAILLSTAVLVRAAKTKHCRSEH
jgi:hypothetical protein